MKKILIAALAAAAWSGASGSAFAQAYNWTGFYTGVNGGWQTQDFKGNFPDFPGSPFSPGRSDQGLAGFYGGYQFQNGNWVVGAESGFDVPLDRNFSSSPNTAPVPQCGYGVGGAGLTQFCQARLDSLFRAGGRLGWAYDRWLVYGTGGYARGLIKIRDLTVIGPLDVADGHAGGWYAGGGIEFMLLNNLFLGVEYKHYDLGRARLGGGATFVRDVSTTADTVMARLTLKIGP